MVVSIVITLGSEQILRIIIRAGTAAPPIFKVRCSPLIIVLIIEVTVKGPPDSWNNPTEVTKI